MQSKFNLRKGFLMGLVSTLGVLLFTKSFVALNETEKARALARELATRTTDEGRAYSINAYLGSSEETARPVIEALRDEAVRLEEPTARSVGTKNLAAEALEEIQQLSSTQPELFVAPVTTVMAKELAAIAPAHGATSKTLEKAKGSYDRKTIAAGIAAGTLLVGAAVAGGVAIKRRRAATAAKDAEDDTGAAGAAHRPGSRTVPAAELPPEDDGELARADLAEALAGATPLPQVVGTGMEEGSEIVEPWMHGPEESYDDEAELYTSTEQIVNQILDKQNISADERLKNRALTIAIQTTTKNSSNLQAWMIIPNQATAYTAIAYIMARQKSLSDANSRDLAFAVFNGYVTVWNTARKNKDNTDDDFVYRTKAEEVENCTFNAIKYSLKGKKSFAKIFDGSFNDNVQGIIFVKRTFGRNTYGPNIETRIIEKDACLSEEGTYPLTKEQISTQQTMFGEESRSRRTVRGEETAARREIYGEADRLRANAEFLKHQREEREAREAEIDL